MMDPSRRAEAGTKADSPSLSLIVPQVETPVNGKEVDAALTREKKRDRILSGEREEISIKRKVWDITTESKAQGLITGIKSSAEFLWPMGAMKQVQ